MPTLQIHNPATGALLAEPTADDAASVAAKAAAARAALPAWAACRWPRSWRWCSASAPASWPNSTRWPPPDAGDGQADQPVAQRAQRPAAAHRLLPRADRRRDPRRTCLRRRRHARADLAHPAGRGGQHLGLELPLVRRLQRHRAGAADRQRGALQALGTCHADGAAHRAPAACRRRAGRRDAVPGGRRRGRRRAAGAAAGRRVLHRQPCHRRAHRAARWRRSC